MAQLSNQLQAASLGPSLPVDVQRCILLKVLEKPLHYCPKDNAADIRENGRTLARASLVSREWNLMCYPLLYASVCLPRTYHLERFRRTLNARPDLGLLTTYFHFFGDTLPHRFIKLFYSMPNVRHFLTQADATKILDEDIEPDRPKPKLITLEIDPGLHDEQGYYIDARVDRWCDLSELQSLALVGMEALNNIPLGHPLPHLQELHLLHHEDDMDPSPESHHLILTILKKVGRQLRTLRIDEFSSDILLAPTEIFDYCPNLITFSVSGLDILPLIDRGHPRLQNLLLGDPWSYHTQVADREGEEVRHELTEEDKVVIQHVLQRSAKERFPRLRAILLWNVSFKEEKNRTDREIKSVCEELKRKHGWMVGDRYACGRDPRWAIMDDFGTGRTVRQEA